VRLDAGMENLICLTDIFGKDAAELKQKKLFLFDMDGTIYEEERLFDGTLDLLQTITHSGGKYVFITNNSSKSVTDYIARMKRFGICAEKDNFFTSAQAAVLYLEKEYPGRKIYCQGTKSLIAELKAASLAVTEEASEDVDVVLVGFDTELTSQKLRNTCKLLQRDIPFLATNPDLACPVSFGFIPDCGSICQMLTNATGKTPVYIGKPERIMVDIVRKKLGYSEAETVVIGDRLYTDIASGVNAHVTTVAVLTGETTVREIAQSSIKPAFTFGSVEDIYRILKTDP